MILFSVCFSISLSLSLRCILRLLLLHSALAIHVIKIYAKICSEISRACYSAPSATAPPGYAPDMQLVSSFIQQKLQAVKYCHAQPTAGGKIRIGIGFGIGTGQRCMTGRGSRRERAAGENHSVIRRRQYKYDSNEQSCMALSAGAH